MNKFKVLLLGGLLLGFVLLDDGGFAQVRVAPAGTKSGFVEVDGARLYYEETGDGEPLVLIHGGLLDLTMWDDLVTEFADEYRVLRFDMRGHGRTESPPVSFSYLADLESLLEKLSVGKAAFVGLSMGCGPVWHLVLERPERVSRVVMVSPGFEGGGPPSKELKEHEDAMGKALLFFGRRVR